MKRKTISELLREAILEYRRDTGTTYDLERGTGVKRASMGRFLKGERSLRLDKAEALCSFLGIESVRRKKGR